ncbi:MAG: MATE family efflux transporter, partial [Fibrobacter sp.]|nr:MATE family efflux transporter [Fibrobacter sp.]
MEKQNLLQTEQNEDTKGDTLIKDLTTGSVSQKLIHFSIPLILANLMQVLYNVVDMIVVGQFIDSAGISAVSNGGDIMHMVTILCIGFSTAGQIIIAQLVGKNDREGIKKAIGTLFSFMGIIAVIITILSLFLVDWFIITVNVPLEARVATKEYCVIFFVGMVFIFGYNAVSAILRGMGDSKRPFIFITIATFLNLILDLLFVEDLGIKGVAFTTVIAQATSFIFSIIYLYSKRDAFGFDFKLKSFVIHGPSLKFLLKLGLPLGLLYGSVTISKLFINSWVNSYGVILSALTGIGTKIGQVASIVTSAFGTAGATMIGQSVGAKKISRINRIISVSLGWGLLYTGFLSIIFALFSDQIFGLFTRDAEVLSR